MNPKQHNQKIYISLIEKRFNPRKRSLENTFFPKAIFLNLNKNNLRGNFFKNTKI